MLRKLASNTLVTGTAFIVTGLVPVFLVPLFVGRFGLGDYGVLVLCRLFLPTGALAVFDLGNSETASFSVTRALHDSDWTRSGRYIGGLFLVATASGVLAAVLVAAGASAIAEVFRVAPASRPGFVRVLFVSAAAMPILMGSLVGEGVVRGFEMFKRLRAIDVATSGFFALAAVGAVTAGYPFQWAGFAFVAAGVVRAALLLFTASRLLDALGCRLGVPTSGEWTDLRRRCIPLGINRVIGVGQAYLPTALVGAMLGTAAVAVYDLVTRIPRFLKVVSGVLNSALLPMVMRLDAAGDLPNLKRLLKDGLLGVVVVVFPLTAWCICFSEAILRLWVGDEYSPYWRWQSLMFVWPVLNALTSFMCGALLGRPRFVAALNWIILGQVVLQIVASVLLVPVFAEQAFVAGQILALCLSMPLQVGLAAKHVDLTWADFRRHMRVGLIFAGLAGVGLALDVAPLVRSEAELAVGVFVWGLTSCLLAWWLVLTTQERQAMFSQVRRQLRRAG
jgi:O-antigen/teichoic acid export membrane protein